MVPELMNIHQIKTVLWRLCLTRRFHRACMNPEKTIRRKAVLFMEGIIAKIKSFGDTKSASRKFRSIPPWLRFHAGTQPGVGRDRYASACPHTSVNRPDEALRESDPYYPPFRSPRKA